MKKLRQLFIAAALLTAGAAWADTDVTGECLTNADFEGAVTSTTHPNATDGRHLDVPEGWNVTCSFANTYSYTAMTPDDPHPGDFFKNNYAIPSNDKRYMVRLTGSTKDWVQLEQTFTVPYSGKYTFSAKMIRNAGEMQVNLAAYVNSVSRGSIGVSAQGSWETRSFNASLTKGESVTVRLKLYRSSNNGTNCFGGVNDVVVKYVENVGKEDLAALIAQTSWLNTKTSSSYASTISDAQTTYTGIDNTPTSQTAIDNAISNLQTAITSMFSSSPFNPTGEDISGIIPNASFEHNVDGSARTTTSSVSNTTLQMLGWTQSTPSASYSNTKIVDKDTDNASPNGKRVTPSDGNYYFYFRNGWNGSGATYTLTSKNVMLPAGHYVLTMDYKAVNQYEPDSDTKGKTNVSLVAKSGDSELSSVQSADVTSIAKNVATEFFGDSYPWNTITTEFTLNEAGSIIVILKMYAGGPVRSDFILDNVTLTYYTPISTTINEEVAYVPSDGVANVTLTRTIKADTWNSFVVPFDMNYDELKATFGNSVEIAEYSETAVGENSTVTFSKMATPAVSANVPVLLKTSTASDGDYTINGRIIEPTAGPKVEGAGNYDFVGSYAASTEIAEGDYYLSNNTIYKSKGLGSTIKGTRAYIKAKSAGARIAQFVIEDDGQTTGVDIMEDVRSKMEEGSAFYDLQGRKVGTQLKKGLYVRQGKKVVIK